MDWNVVIEIGKVVGGAAVALAAIWKVAPKIWKSMCGWIMNDLNLQITKMSEDITFIVSELRLNGGTSVKDAINRNEATLLRIEANLSLANERQRARMLDTPEMIFETDVNGDCVWVNRTYTRTVQRAMPELLGKGWVNGIASDEREGVVSEWYKSVEEDREFEMDFSFQTPDGIMIPITCRSYRMRDQSTGRIIGYLGHCEEIAIDGQ